MKKLLTLFGLQLFVIGMTFGQSCQPDPIFQDSTAGVYPSPFDPVASPEGGIPDTACIGVPFEFVFTIVVSETVELFGGVLPLDSIRIDEVQGLPDGLEAPDLPFVVCNPESCTFIANTQGCALISGTPTGEANADGVSGPGDYDLTIVGTAFISGLGAQQLTFPGVLAPGSYTLTVADMDSSPCNVNSTDNLLASQIEVAAFPNPATDATVISVASDITSEIDIQIVDMVGKIVQTQREFITVGGNNILVNTSSLSAGMYVYTIRNEMGAVAQKLIISRR